MANVIDVIFTFEIFNEISSPISKSQKRRQCEQSLSESCDANNDRLIFQMTI